jgi:hypothetical protein
VDGEFVDETVANGTPACYQVVVVGSVSGILSGPSAMDCVVPKVDPNPPRGAVVINDDTRATRSLRVLLGLIPYDDPATQEYLDPGEPPVFEGTEVSGVTQMRIWNPGQRPPSTWEPILAVRPWRIAPRGGVARVFVQFRDAAGNASPVISDSILFSR